MPLTPLLPSNALSELTALGLQAAARSNLGVQVIDQTTDLVVRTINLQDLSAGNQGRISLSDFAYSFLDVNGDAAEINAGAVNAQSGGFASLQVGGVNVATTSQLAGKQDTLVSGTNIKTVNSQSLLGSGDISISGGVSGDVVGPSSATDNAIARFDTTTGKLLQNSNSALDDSGNASFGGSVTAKGNVGGGRATVLRCDNDGGGFETASRIQFRLGGSEFGWVESGFYSAYGAAVLIGHSGGTTPNFVVSSSQGVVFFQDVYFAGSGGNNSIRRNPSTGATELWSPNVGFNFRNAIGEAVVFSVDVNGDVSSIRNLTASGTVDGSSFRQTGNTTQALIPSGGIWYLDCTSGIRMRDPGSGYASRFEVDGNGGLTVSGGLNLAPRTKAAVLASSPATNAGRFQLSDSGLVGREVYPDGTNWRYASDDSIVT